MPILNADYSDIDYEEMAASIGLQSKHMPMLIDSFLEESIDILTALESAVPSSDFTMIKSKAHSIKGSAGNLKFKEVYEMAKEMELAAANSDVGFDYASYFKAVKQAIGTIPN